MRVLVGMSGLAGLAAFAFAVDPALAASPAANPATVEAAVLGRAVARGEVLAADDFTTAPRSAAQARGVLAAADAAGREAVRNLAAGSVVRASDLVQPRLVRRGEPVTITIRSGGLAIATGGRALASGGAGDLVRVVSLSTNRTLDGTVEGPNAVRVVAP